LAPHQIAKSKSIEPLKNGSVLLYFLEPTLKTKPSEFKDLKEMILYTPTLDTQTETPLHPLAKPLLQESSHVIPKDIHHSLTPKRIVQHHINLIPRAILPNKHWKKALFQPRDYGVYTFNGSYLKPYFDDGKLENLRENYFLEGEDDAPMGDQ